MSFPLRYSDDVPYTMVATSWDTSDSSTETPTVNEEDCISMNCLISKYGKELLVATFHLHNQSDPSVQKVYVEDTSSMGIISSAHPRRNFPAPSCQDRRTMCGTSESLVKNGSPRHATKRALSTGLQLKGAKGQFICRFCEEEGIPKTCTRKNDLKRHIEEFHHTDAQWVCQQKECNMAFELKAAYKAHMKERHPGSRLTDSARIQLCEQTVFACGFENCSQVYEAGVSKPIKEVYKKYLTHIVKHYDEVNAGSWTYSGKIRNLLRQLAMNDTGIDDWFETNGGRQQMEWDPQTSNVLRKILETRHIEDASTVARCALALATNVDVAHDATLTATLKRPTRDLCRFNMPGNGCVVSLDNTARLSEIQSHTYGVACMSPRYGFRPSGSRPMYSGIPDYIPQSDTMGSFSPAMNSHDMMGSLPRTPGGDMYTHFSPMSYGLGDLPAAAVWSKSAMNTNGIDPRMYVNIDQNAAAMDSPMTSLSDLQAAASSSTASFAQFGLHSPTPTEIG